MKHLIRLNWEGPSKHNNLDDNVHGSFGLYQIYGPHPTYCTTQLLYIGLTTGNIAVRSHMHEWKNSTRDCNQVELYYCRASLDEVKSEAELRNVEQLLIYAHFPPYNTQKWAAETNSNLLNYHILNLGDYRDLLPEISGLRWVITKQDSK